MAHLSHQRQQYGVASQRTLRQARKDALSGGQCRRRCWKQELHSPGPGRQSWHLSCLQTCTCSFHTRFSVSSLNSPPVRPCGGRTLEEPSRVLPWPPFADCGVRHDSSGNSNVRNLLEMPTTGLPALKYCDVFCSGPEPCGDGRGGGGVCGLHASAIDLCPRGRHRYGLNGTGDIRQVSAP